MNRYFCSIAKVDEEGLEDRTFQITFDNYLEIKCILSNPINRELTGCFNKLNRKD